MWPVTLPDSASIVAEPPSVLSVLLYPTKILPLYLFFSLLLVVLWGCGLLDYVVLTFFVTCRCHEVWSVVGAPPSPPWWFWLGVGGRASIHWQN